MIPDFEAPLLLTPREREVYLLAVDRLTLKGIGYRLGIRLDTVKTHIMNIREKLALDGACTLREWALEQMLEAE
jgi:DNA-binding CsgD family transcriptional regulator